MRKPLNMRLLGVGVFCLCLSLAAFPGVRGQANGLLALVGIDGSTRADVTAGHALKTDGSSVTQPVAGDVAAAASDSGNPVKIGAVAQNAEPTAVTNGQRSNLHTDLAGKAIVLPYANPENFVVGALASDITGTASTQIIAAEGAGVRTYITSILVTNMHASVDTRVDILDGATLVATGFAAHGGGGYSLTLPTPIRCTANTAVNVQDGTTGAQVRATVAGYKGS